MKVAVLIMWLVILVTGLTLGSLYLISYSDWHYKGKETFQTEQEYTQFKNEIARDDVKVVSFSALSSDPPIVVTYHVEVMHDVEFPYGERSHDESWVGLPLVGGLLGFLLTLLLVLQLYGARREEKR